SRQPRPARSARPAAPARRPAQAARPPRLLRCPARARATDSRGRAARRRRAPCARPYHRAMHLTEAVLAPLRERYGEPRPLRWEGEVSAEEFTLAGSSPE